MRELVVLGPLTPMKVGDEFAAGAIPLHVTVLPNVRVAESALPELIDRIAVISNDTPTASTIAGATERFGADRDIIVTTLHITASIRRLHARLSDAARAVGGVVVDPDYNGDGYQPHVTRTATGDVAPAARVELTSLVTLDCTTLTRIVIASEPLRGDDSGQ